jgi:hypothetical protein
VSSTTAGVLLSHHIPAEIPKDVLTITCFPAKLSGIPSLSVAKFSPIASQNDPIY